MSKLFFSFLFLSLPFQAFCMDRWLEPVKFQDQQDFYIQGGLGILSQKNCNSILFYQTNEYLCEGKANFYFVFNNDTDGYVNFLIHNVRVTDQFGRPVRIVPMHEHLDRIRSSANLKTFFNIALGGLNLFCAHDAGRVDYCTSGHRDVHGFSHSRGRYGHHERFYEQGTYHSRALQRAAERESILMTAFLERGIQDEYQLKKFKYENFYLSSNTVPPHSVYSANFQVEVPKFMQVDLQYLYFTFDAGGEKHTFATFCGTPKSGRSYF